MLKDQSSYSRTASIYPGIYQPVFVRERQGKIKGSKPPVNIMEFADYYEIEMPAPGFQKGDFLVRSNGCSLLIIGYKKCIDNAGEARYHQHGFQCKYITRTIDLPGDADTEFGTAEYREGVLYIYLYKTRYPVQNHQNIIIVY